MNRITEYVYSHISIEKNTHRKNPVTDVTRSKGLRVSGYSELVHHIASIGYENPKYTIFYRGQEKDWKVKVKTKEGPRKWSSIIPEIFRDNNFALATKNNMANNDRALELAEKLLISNKEIRDRRLLHCREMQWAILQHYRIVPTPLVDVTQSLRVAASFATMKKSGFVYVFGLPPLHGSISYFVDEKMVAVRLQSACPPKARRPHFQEGYLVGHFPTDVYKRSKFHIGRTLNLGNRMLAKFFIPDGKQFWKKGFNSIPEAELFPPDDPMIGHLVDIQQRIHEEFPEVAKRLKI